MTPEMFERLKELKEKQEELVETHEKVVEKLKAIEQEAKQYFESLDYALEKYRDVTYFCSNCGWPLMAKDSPYHKLSKSKKCSSEMARRMAMTPDDIPRDEWYLLEEAHRRRLREANPPPTAYKLKKPSWLQRLLDWIF